MQYISPISLANTFILLGNKEDIPITQMKLQRLLYLAYKNYLKEYNLPLFSSRFEAWKYGPVIRYIYDKICCYKDTPITELISDNSGKILIAINDKNCRFIEKVWNKYKNYTGIELSNMICNLGFAWKEAIMNGTFILSDDDIKCELDY